MEETKKTWTIYKVYLLIASLVGLIGGLVSLWVGLTSLGQRLIITNEEYVNGQRYYELQECKDRYYYGKTTEKEENRKPTEEQVKTCEEDKTKKMILWRNVDVKETVLWGAIRAILFTVLFFTHYPRFRKENNA